MPLACVRVCGKSREWLTLLVKRTTPHHTPTRTRTPKTTQVLRAYPGAASQLEDDSITKELKQQLAQLWDEGGQSHLADVE